MSSTEETEHHETPSTSTTQEQQLNDLQDSFGESFDEEEATVTDRLLRDDTVIHMPATPAVQQQQQQQQQNRGPPAVLPVSMDGVFANMSAKPETESNKLDETPPVNRYIYKLTRSSRSLIFCYIDRHMKKLQRMQPHRIGKQPLSLQLVWAI